MKIFIERCRIRNLDFILKNLNGSHFPPELLHGFSSLTSIGDTKGDKCKNSNVTNGSSLQVRKVNKKCIGNHGCLRDFLGGFLTHHMPPVTPVQTERAGFTNDNRMTIK
jgi:hypothetical protein